MSSEEKPSEEDSVVQAARQAAKRTKENKENPEPSLGNRLGQIGALGWAIIVPILLGVVIGRWLDRALSTGIMFSAALIMLGAAAGLYSAWKWMHRP